MKMYVYLSASIPPELHAPVFVKSCVYVTYRRKSVFFCWSCDMSSTFDCMDNAIFAHNGNNRHLLLPFFEFKRSISL